MLNSNRAVVLCKMLHVLLRTYLWMRGILPMPVKYPSPYFWTFPSCTSWMPQSTCWSPRASRSVLPSHPVWQVLLSRNCSCLPSWISLHTFWFPFRIPVYSYCGICQLIRQYARCTHTFQSHCLNRLFGGRFCLPLWSLKSLCTTELVFVSICLWWLYLRILWCLLEC